MWFLTDFLYMDEPLYMFGRNHVNIIYYSVVLFSKQLQCETKIIYFQLFAFVFLEQFTNTKEM